MIKDIIVGGISAIGDIIDELHTSDEEKAKAKLRLMQLADAPASRQAAITLAEAKHPSVFVAGWRPAVGWVCASGLFVTVVGWPLAAVGARFGGIDLGENPVDTGLILAILPALLGVAGLRTWEKRSGVARDNMKS